MSPEERELLQKTADLVADNNEMLRTMQRSMRLGNMMTIVYWLFIIGTAVGAYYFVQPYLDQVTGAYGGARNTITVGLENLKSIGGLMDKLKMPSQ